MENFKPCGAVIVKKTTLDTIMYRQKDKQCGVKRIADEMANRSREATADYFFGMEDTDIKQQQH